MKKFVGQKCDECPFGYRDYPRCKRCKCDGIGRDPASCQNGMCSCADDGQCVCKVRTCIELSKLDTCLNRGRVRGEGGTSPIIYLVLLFLMIIMKWGGTKNGLFERDLNKQPPQMRPLKVIPWLRLPRLYHKCMCDPWLHCI